MNVQKKVEFGGFLHKYWHSLRIMYIAQMASFY